jgi:hypothetical protein
MSEDQNLDAAIESMQKISAAIKEFDDPELRAQAFEILTARAFKLQKAGGDGASTIGEPVRDAPSGTGGGASHPDEDSVTATRAATPQKRPARKSSKKGTYDVPKDVDWAPTGKVSLHDFAAEKLPTTNPERALLATYYIANTLERTVTTGLVLAAFRALGWKDPSNPDNNLQQAGSKHWLDTKDMADIKVVWGGQRYVENELPKAPKTK